MSSSFSPPIRNGYVVLPSLKATGPLYCRPFFFTTQLLLCSLHFSTTTTILSLSSLLDHTVTVTLSSSLHHYQHNFCRRPSFPTAQPRLCCLPFAITTSHLRGYVVFPPPPSPSPPQCLVVHPPHQKANDIFPLSSPLPPQFYCRPFLFTTLPQLPVCYLPSSTTSTTTVLSSFPLCHTATVILSRLLHHIVMVMLSSLLHHHRDQKTPEILLLTRSQFWPKS